jgi:hypothetical protein
MDAPRPRFGSAFEWVVAAAFLLATAAVAWLIVSEMRAVRTPSRPRPETESAPATEPATVPAGAISVPVLILLDGREVRVGDPLRKVTDHLGAGTDLESGAGKSRFGKRLTKAFEQGSTRFVLVFEPFERNGEPRVTAIYLR